MLSVIIALMQMGSYAPLLPAPESDGGMLVINEIMIDPLSSSSTEMGQWIELYNNSDQWINLSEWTIENQSGQSIVFSSFILAPESYFVVGASGLTSENGGYTPNAVWGSFSLSSEGSLSLSGRYIIEVTEYISWNASWNLLSGASLERVNPGWASNDSESWSHSTIAYGDGDLGTPGTQNSVYSNGFGQNTWAFIKAFVR
jgi:hypothetical protein